MKTPHPTSNNLSRKTEKSSEKEISNTFTLRQQAEKLLKIQKKLLDTTAMPEYDMIKLIHELEVHQIELEMQNDELKQAKENAEDAEKKYTELYNFAPAGYLSLNKKGEISELNFMAASMLGKERLFLKNSLFIFYLTNDTRIVFNRFFNNIFKNQKKQSCEAAITRNSDIPLHINVSGIKGQKNEQCDLTIVDISECKLAEIELIKAKERAQEGDRLKSAFLANMSHEIRTPMNGILGFASLLGEDDLSEELQKKYISIIVDSGKRMLSIINDIVDISKIEAGLMKLNLTQSNVNKQIEYVYTFFKPEVKQKGMKLLVKNNLPENMAMIYTDREKIFAVLINLVKNAIKFTEKGYIEFGVSAGSPTNSTGGPIELQFYVKDTGIGIPKDRQKLIFQRFVQADNSDSKSFTGAGLGLSISKAYIEMLGGKMWVESGVDNISTSNTVGSTFFFTIPYNETPLSV